jgi:hypothetical protein
MSEKELLIHLFGLEMKAEWLKRSQQQRIGK